MTAITIQVSDEQVTRLKERARVLGVSIEDAARMAIEKGTSEDSEIEPEDPEFNKTADRIIEQNAELYRRLA